MDQSLKLPGIQTWNDWNQYKYITTIDEEAEFNDFIPYKNKINTIPQKYNHYTPVRLPLQLTIPYIIVLLQYPRYTIYTLVLFEILG